MNYDDAKTASQQIGGYDPTAKIAQDHLMRNLASQSVGNAAKQATIRERLEGANKRADAISGVLSCLISSVMPPQILAGSNADGGTQQIKDSSLSSDMDDLCRTLARIEQQVSRLTAAISG